MFCCLNRPASRQRVRKIARPQHSRSSSPSSSLTLGLPAFQSRHLHPRKIRESQVRPCPWADPRPARPNRNSEPRRPAPAAACVRAPHSVSSSRSFRRCSAITSAPGASRPSSSSPKQAQQAAYSCLRRRADREIPGRTAASRSLSCRRKRPHAALPESGIPPLSPSSLQIRAQHRQSRRRPLHKCHPRSAAAQCLNAHRARASIQIEKARALDPRRQHVEKCLAQPVAGGPRGHPAGAASVRERNFPAMMRIGNQHTRSATGPRPPTISICEAGQFRWAAGWASSCAFMPSFPCWRSSAWASAPRTDAGRGLGLFLVLVAGGAGARNRAAVGGRLARPATARHPAAAHRRPLCLRQP